MQLSGGADELSFKFWDGVQTVGLPEKLQFKSNAVTGNYKQPVGAAWCLLFFCSKAKRRAP